MAADDAPAWPGAVLGEVPAWRRAVLGVVPGLRPFPWRATRDPWAVLVSEVMLQQTQAPRVVGPWSAFLERFPAPAECAAAPTGDVVRLWSGLGYNRRAVRLRATAAAIVERHGGAVPDDLRALLALPGVGPYTARAVLAFAFEQDVAVVDTNVRRVLCRALVGGRAAPAALQDLADALVPAGRGWAWNQALLELGATRCTGRSPRCDGCPLAPRCRWRAAGRPEPDPGGGVPAQAPFAGSDRQGRGRLVRRLCAGSLAPADVAEAAGWPRDPGRARRAADALVAEGLATRDAAGVLHLA